MAYEHYYRPMYKQSGLMAIHQQNVTHVQPICCDKNGYDIAHELGVFYSDMYYEIANLPAGIYEFVLDEKLAYNFVLHHTLAGGDRLRFNKTINNILAVVNLHPVYITPYKIMSLSPDAISIPKAVNGSLDVLSLVGFDYISTQQEASRSWTTPLPHDPTTSIRYVSKQNNAVVCDKIISLKDELLAIHTLRDKLHIDRANQLALFEKYLGFLYLTGDEPFEVDESHGSWIFYFRFPEVALNGKIRCSHFPSISMTAMLRDAPQGVSVSHNKPEIGFKIPKEYVKDLDDFRRQLREKYNDPDQEPVTIIYEYARPRTYHKILDGYELPIAVGDNQIQVYNPKYPSIDIGKSYFYKSMWAFPDN